MTGFISAYHSAPEDSEAEPLAATLQNPNRVLEARMTDPNTHALAAMQ